MSRPTFKQQMRKSERIKRINYQTFATTGEKVEINDLTNQIENLSINPIMSEYDELSVEFMTLVSNVADFIDENPIEGELSLSEMKELLEKIESLRTDIRKVHGRLILLDPKNQQYDGEFQSSIKLVKQFVLDVKAAMKVIRQKEINLKQNDESIVNFILRDLELLYESINSEFIDTSKLDDSDLKR